MFGRLGRFVVTRPWWVIGGWFLGAVLIIVLLPKLTDITSTDQGSFLPATYESVQAANLADAAFPKQASASAIVVVKRTDGQPLTTADQARVGQLAQAIAAARVPGLGAPVTGPQSVAANRAVALIALPITAAQNDQEGVTAGIRSIRAAITSDLPGSGLSAGVAGDAATFVDNANTYTTALAVVGLATFAMIILLIVLIFRSPLAAVLPIVVIFFVLQVASNLVATAGRIFGFHVDQSLQTLLLIVLFGIGTDYILFLLFRYRSGLRAGLDRKEAMVLAVARIGEVITSAAAAVIVAFLVLLLASFGGFGSLGPALAIAVFTMLVTALTLIPAVVSLLGHRVFWPSRSWRREPTGTRFHRLGAAVARRPALAAVSGLVLLALASGVLSFRADYDFTAGFPSTTESAKASADLQRGFPQGALNPTQVYLTTVDGQPLRDDQIAAFSSAAGHAPGVGQVQQAVRSPDGTVARIDLLLNENPASNAAIALVRGRLRAALHADAPPGTHALVGGITAVYADINTANNRDLAVILPVAAVLIAVILALLLRSLVAPLYLVLAVLLNFAATLGAAVYLFRDLAGRPGVVFNLPIVLYLFVLAIGTDYNILMIARLREEVRAGATPRDAAALGIERGGPAVAAAGLILAGTFASLSLAPVSFLQQIGFAVAVGILLSAFVMSLFLVPSVTVLVGRTAWWPSQPQAPAVPQPSPVPRTGSPAPVR